MLKSSSKQGARFMDVSTPDGRVNSALVWVPLHGVLLTGGTHCSRFAVVEGGSGACFQGIVHAPTLVCPGDSSEQVNDTICGAHPGLTRSGIDGGTSPVVS